MGLILTISAPVNGIVEPVRQKQHQDIVLREVVVTSFYDSDFIDLVKHTSDLKSGDHLTLTIMSPGGNAFVVLGMMNYLEELKGRGIVLTTKTAGLTASAGALLWMTGDYRITHTGDAVMFHGVVFYGPYGPVKIKDMPKNAQYVAHLLNHYMRQYLLNELHDTELVNELLNDDGNTDTENNNENWFMGEDIYEMGIAHQLIETI